MAFTLRHRRQAGGRYTKDDSLARFVCPPAFVYFTIVISVSRDCMKTTYSSEFPFFLNYIFEFPPPPPTSDLSVLFSPLCVLPNVMIKFDDMLLKRTSP